MSESIRNITLDERSIKPRTKEVVHERNVAIADLLDDNVFEPTCIHCGPYDVVLSVMQSLFAPSTSPSTSLSSSALAAAPPLRRGVSDSSASELSSESDSRRGDSDSRRDMPPLVLLSHAKSVEVSDLLKQKVRHPRDLGVVRL